MLYHRAGRNVMGAPQEGGCGAPGSAEEGGIDSRLGETMKEEWLLKRNFMNRWVFSSLPPSPPPFPSILLLSS